MCGFFGGGVCFLFDPMLLIEFVSVALSYHKRKKKMLSKICVLYCLVSLNSGVTKAVVCAILSVGWCI